MESKVAAQLCESQAAEYWLATFEIEDNGCIGRVQRLSKGQKIDEGKSQSLQVAAYHDPYRSVQKTIPQLLESCTLEATGIKITAIIRT